MSNLGMLYCHSVPDSRFTVSNEVVGIEVGIWYYYHRYLINDCWFIDLKKTDSRFCDTCRVGFGIGFSFVIGG